MSQSLSKRLINKLIDWLLAFIGASLLLWFFLAQPVFIKKTESASHNVDIQQLKSHVQLLTGGYAPRTINYDNLNDAADYIYRQLASFGLPSFQTINTISKQYRNVSLQLGPDTQELYVIGAHYDAEDDSIDTEGNASGVATLIELARHLAENNHRLNIGVVLIAYPLSLNQSDNIVNTGSFFHASSLKEQNKKVRLMISLDSVGRLNKEYEQRTRNINLTSLLYPTNNNYVSLVGRLKDFNNIRELKKGFVGGSSLTLHTHNLLENFNKTQSTDHINYWKQGYPAVLISDEVDSNKKSFDKSNESSIEELNYEKMAELVNGLLQVVVQTKASTDDKLQLAARRSRNKKLNSAL